MNNYSAKELQRALDHAELRRNHYEQTVISAIEKASANRDNGISAPDIFEQAIKTNPKPTSKGK